MKFLLYHHKSSRWADYLIDYTSLGANEKRGLYKLEVLSLPQQNAHAGFASLPPALRRLLFFANPDLVICIDDGVRPIRPMFAVEVSEHVMATDHWMQRFPHLVGCAQQGVPGIYIMPGDMPDRENFAGRVDPAFYYAYDRVIEIHDTPFFIAQWSSSDGATLDMDENYPDLPDHGSADLQNSLQFFELVLDCAIHGREFQSLMRDRIVVDLRDRIRSEGYRALPEVRAYRRLAANMPEGKFLTLEQLESWLSAKRLRLPEDLPDRIVKRSRTLIFVPMLPPKAGKPDNRRESVLSRIHLKGGDPYTGMPLAFDYLFCRLGPTPYERDTNLVIDLSFMRFEDLARYHHAVWEKSPLRETSFAAIRGRIPTYTMHLTEPLAQFMKNFLRIYAFSADMIVFEEGVIYF